MRCCNLMQGLALTGVLLLHMVITEGSIQQLHYYETLHQSEIDHRITKRSVHDANVPTERVVSLTTLGRHFRLHLSKQRGLLARDFSILSVSGNRKNVISMSDDEFMQGYVEGDLGSQVHAYWENGNLVATIKTQHEVYSIEPSWRHLESSEKYSMIAYRGSDVKKMEGDESSMGSHFCGFVHPDGNDEAPYEESQPKTRDIYNKKEGKPKRNKRQTTSKTKCTLALVADYKFTTNVGGGDESATAKYLIGVATRVNALYEDTNFADGYTGLGFEVKEVIVNLEPTVTDGTEHYNMQRDTWETKALLKAFGKEDWSDVCLAHLFTYTAFSDGVLGLAWIANSDVSKGGGICSQPYNTGWTSGVNKYNNRLLTQESDLVTAHEFGHNWGSQHDPETTECAPGQNAGGKYLMYMYSVNGFDSNNEVLSPCSTRAIHAVLENKQNSCFQEPSTSFCGNYKVEEGEDCDAGAKGKAGNDPCCDANCKLKEGAICSDANSECCSGCQFSDSFVICRNTGDLITSCEANAYCSGISASCPPITKKPDGTDCIDNGKCQNGVCLSFCESIGLVSCACDTVDVSCKTCCRAQSGRENNTNPCTPYQFPTNQSYIDLSDGKSCVQGSCNKGVCVKEIRQLSDRLWDVIENLDINYILRFMTNNVVLTVVVLSLIIYIPLCIIVCCIDKRRDDDDDNEVEWRKSNNDQVIRPGDETRIRQTYRKTRKPSSKVGKLPPLSKPPSTPESSVKSSATTRGVRIVPVDY